MKAERIKSLKGCLSDYAYTSDNDWEAFNELINKATKWDMIESAIENEVMFVDAHNDCINGHQTLTRDDIEYLEKLCDKRGAE